VILNGLAAWSYSIFKLLWIGVCVHILFSSLAVYLKPNVVPQQTELGFAVAMLTLSFPSSYAAGFLITPLYKCYGVAGESSIASVIRIVGLWVTMFMAGYVQWFVVIPWIAKKLREHRRTMSIGG
jgi:hypothetical protein